MNINCRNKATLTLNNNLKLFNDDDCDEAQVEEYRTAIKNLISSERHKCEDYWVTNSPESLKAITDVVISNEVKLNESLLRFICLFIKSNSNNPFIKLTDEQTNEIRARICLISYHVTHSHLSVETDDIVKNNINLLFYVAKSVFIEEIIRHIQTESLFPALEELFYLIASYLRQINYKSNPNIKPTTYNPLIQSIIPFLSIYPTQINTLKMREMIIDNNCISLSEILGETFSKLIENEQNYKIIYKIISPLFESVNTTFNQSISSFLLTFVKYKPSIGLIYIQYIQNIIKSNSKNELIRFSLNMLLLLCHHYHTLPISNYHLFLYALYHNTYKIQLFILNNMKDLIGYLPNNNDKMKNDFYWLSFRIINQILIESENNSLYIKYFDIIKFILPYIINIDEYKKEVNINMINMTYKLLLTKCNKEEEYNIILNFMNETRECVEYDIYKLLSLYSTHKADNVNGLLFNFILLLISDKECHIITKYLYEMEIHVTNKNDKLYENFIYFISYLIKEYPMVMKSIVDSLNNRLYTLDLVDFPIEIITLYYTLTNEVFSDDLQSTLSLKIQSFTTINDSDTVFILLRYSILSKNELLLSSIIKYLPNIYNNSFSYSIPIWKDIIFILHQFHILDDFIYEQVNAIEKDGVTGLRMNILLYFLYHIIQDEFILLTINNTKLHELLLNYYYPFLTDTQQSDNEKNIIIINNYIRKGLPSEFIPFIESLLIDNIKIESLTIIACEIVTLIAAKSSDLFEHYYNMLLNIVIDNNNNNISHNVKEHALYNILHLLPYESPNKLLISLQSLLSINDNNYLSIIYTETLELIKKGEIPSIYYSQLVLSYLKENKHLSNQFISLFYQLLPSNKANQNNYVFNIITAYISYNDNNNYTLLSSYISEIKKIVPYIWKNKQFQKQIIMKYNVNKKYSEFLLLKSLNIKEKELIELVQCPKDIDELSDKERIEINEYISALKENKNVSKKNEEKISKNDDLLFKDSFEFAFDESSISKAIQNYEKKDN